MNDQHSLRQGAALVRNIGHFIPFHGGSNTKQDRAKETTSKSNHSFSQATVRSLFLGRPQQVRRTISNNVAVPGPSGQEAMC